MNYFSLLAVSTQEQINIGDYIQALASAQFYNFLSEIPFIEREMLSNYNGPNTKVIMNGWFMHNPSNWPPSNQIEPLFVSFHINELAKDSMLNQKSIEYLKNHEPIGCRDYFTCKILQEKGINSYFSGCMTLTLGLKYKESKKNNNYYFVDPYYDNNMTLLIVFRSACNLLLYFKTIKKITGHLFKYSTLKNLLRAANFHSIYSSLFSNKVLEEAIFINHQGRWFKEYTNEQLLVEAEKLVRYYAGAKLVVTSRIHCALPCLGIETPVLYVENENQSNASSCRLDGLKQLFNIVQYRKRKLYPIFKMDDSKISSSTTIRNKTNYLEYKNILIRKVKDFKYNPKIILKSISIN